MEAKKKKKKGLKIAQKTLKNHKKFFLQIFRNYKGGVGGSDQILKIPDFFLRVTIWKTCIKHKPSMKVRASQK